MFVSPSEDSEKNIMNMYNEWHGIDDIFAISGFKGRSKVFRILNKHSVTLNPGRIAYRLNNKIEK